MQRDRGDGTVGTVDQFLVSDDRVVAVGDLGAVDQDLVIGKLVALGGVEIAQAAFGSRGADTGADHKREGLRDLIGTVVEVRQNIDFVGTVGKFGNTAQLERTVVFTDAGMRVDGSVNSSNRAQTGSVAVVVRALVFRAVNNSYDLFQVAEIIAERPAQDIEFLTGIDLDGVLGFQTGIDLAVRGELERIDVHVQHVQLISGRCS